MTHTPSLDVDDEKLNCLVSGTNYYFGAIQFHMDLNSISIFNQSIDVALHWYMLCYPVTIISILSTKGNSVKILYFDSINSNVIKHSYFFIFQRSDKKSQSIVLMDILLEY